MARSTSYTQDKAIKICERLARGRSMKSIATDDDMPAQGTIYVWLRDNEEFQEIYARARETQADAIFDECLSIADDKNLDTSIDEDGKLIVDGEAIQRARLRIDTRKWMAGKLRPKKYGDKLDLTATSTVSHTVSPEDRAILSSLGVKVLTSD